MLPSAAIESVSDDADDHVVLPRVNLRRISLLIWAGANPRSRGPALDDVDHLDDHEWHTAAMSEHVHRETLMFSND